MEQASENLERILADVSGKTSQKLNDIPPRAEPSVPGSPKPPKNPIGLVSFCGVACVKLKDGPPLTVLPPFIWLPPNIELPGAVVWLPAPKLKEVVGFGAGAEAFVGTPPNIGALFPEPLACAKGFEIDAPLLPPALKVKEDAPAAGPPPPPPAPKLKVDDAAPGPELPPPKLKSKLWAPAPLGVAPKETAGEAFVLPPKLKDGGAAASAGFAAPKLNDGAAGLFSVAGLGAGAPKLNPPLVAGAALAKMLVAGACAGFAGAGCDEPNWKLLELSVLDAPNSGAAAGLGASDELVLNSGFALSAAAG